MDILLGLRRVAQNFGDRTAVIDWDTRFAWREVDCRVRRLSRGLRQHGLQRGDRIALPLLNGYSYLELYYAVQRIGALVVPLNHRLAEPELAAILADSGASVRGRRTASRASTTDGNHRRRTHSS
jgi:acyl-CoA synthetase (AMP-forming)/AMP-acid ligase II